MEIVRVEGSRLVKRSVDHYNLDMIISVGYRVNSVNATAFRRWATTILKQYLLRGYSINQQLIQMEDRIDHRLESQHDEIQRIKEVQEKQQSQIDFFVRTSLPPVEGIFFDGQMWVGVSIKDLGKKWTAIMRMETLDPASLLSHL
ncbi:MAG: virulence RhuM family protein [Bacteroidales bacterium]|nr:virulence RhuM family protein [Bacteroidales bacterium]